MDTLPGYASDHRSAGLNEFEVYAAEVPEPSSAFLLGGGLLTALLLVLRRRTTLGPGRAPGAGAI